MAGNDIGPTSSPVPPPFPGQHGVLLSATGSTSTIVVAGPLFGFGDVNLIDTIPQIQLTDSTITQTGSDGLIRVHGLATIGGSLIAATNSIINSDSNLLEIQGGGGAQLVMNSANPNSPNPVAVFNGGSYTFGADSSGINSPNSLFYLQGINTDAAGLGTDQPIKGNGAQFTVADPFNPGTATATNPIGSLLEATGGANIQVQKGAADASSAAVRIDTALFEASAPIINLVGSLTGQTQLMIGAAADPADANRALDLNSANVMSKGPVIALDKGLITVNNGPLINLVGSKMLVDANGLAMIRLSNGSQINVVDLFRLSTASKINVVNGPLVLVDGVGSTLTASGALVNFNGSGGSQIIVNNSICGGACAVTSGIQVSGSNIAIGPNPIKNPGLGSISVSGTNTAVIRTTNGGVVNILAP